MGDPDAGDCPDRADNGDSQRGSTRPTRIPTGTGEPVRVVFLGRIGDHKGTFRLLDAWAELARDRDSVATGKAGILTIAGDGEVERARDRIRELGLEDTVEVHEWLSESEVGELLDHSQVLVLPSRNEGQPMAVLEAMARGLCVIATDVGGLPEMIGGGCGVLDSARRHRGDCSGFASSSFTTMSCALDMVPPPTHESRTSSTSASSGAGSTHSIARCTR